MLEEIGASDIPVLEVFNKIDLLHDEPLPVMPREGVTISARTGEGVDALLAAVEGRIIRNYQEVRMLIPFDHGEVLAALRERGRVEQTEYLPEGIEVRLALRRADLGRFRQYIVEG